MWRVVWLRPCVYDNGTTRHAWESLRSLRLQLQAIIGAEDFIVDETEQERSDQVFLKGIGTAAKRIMDLAIMKSCIQGSVGGQK
jgi:hypothetical protein